MDSNDYLETIFTLKSYIDYASSLPNISDICVRSRDIEMNFRSQKIEGQAIYVFNNNTKKWCCYFTIKLFGYKPRENKIHQWPHFILSFNKKCQDDEEYRVTVIDNVNGTSINEGTIVETVNNQFIDVVTHLIRVYFNKMITEPKYRDWKYNNNSYPENKSSVWYVNKKVIEKVDEKYDAEFPPLKK